MSDGSRQTEVSAEVIGPWAIHRTLKGDSTFRYTLSHIPTGRSATRARSVRSLRDLARRLNAKWPHPAFDVRFPDQMPSGAREFVQLWQDNERDA